MRAPEELFTIHTDVEFDEPPILLYAFAGFVDAGAGVRLAAEHVLDACSHRLVATFDADELLDYRARAATTIRGGIPATECRQNRRGSADAHSPRRLFSGPRRRVAPAGATAPPGA